ncbi:unnamed protein product [Plutella xylostella]|uniref:(diamondback moth) hypothetical protein n=1 Tax=Plutella xylostella TaxID=51655 RepID=A0A8S4FNZ4_PLUXY|nr:unnamed protein product [Plutella xylostella]
MVLPNLHCYPVAVQKRPLSLSRLCVDSTKAQWASPPDLSASSIAIGLELSESIPTSRRGLPGCGRCVHNSCLEPLVRDCMPPVDQCRPATLRRADWRDLKDCAVLGSRLVFRPEATAWAFTDGQLRAALACVAALAQPVKRATAQATRAKAARKVGRYM